MEKRAKYYFLFIFIIFFSCLSLKAEKFELTKKYEFGSEENKEEMFFQVIDIEVSPTGDIFILDSGNNCIKKFSSSYKYLGEVGKRGQGPGEMMTPLNLEIGTDRCIYLNDLGNRRINIYDDNLKYIKSTRLEKLERPNFDSMFIDRDSRLIILASPKVV